MATPAVTKISNGSDERTGRTLAILGCGKAHLASFIQILDLKAHMGICTGNMGTAILLGVLSAQTSQSQADAAHLLPARFIACVRRTESADRIKLTLSSHAPGSTVRVYTNNNVDAVGEADIVLLACQPHLYKSVFEEAGMVDALKGKLIISVLAGVTSDEIESHLHQAAFANPKPGEDDALAAHSDLFPVVRVMPNIASAVQASSTAVLETRRPQQARSLAEHFEATAHAIFSCVGTVFATRPETFAICTTLNGSTPAFFAMVIDGLVDGAVALGLPHTEATQMAAATMRGTAELVISGKRTQDLRYEVACPGGSTVQGSRVLEEASTRAVWMDAMRVATSEQNGLGEGLKVQRNRG
ncbi:hypothetical protein AK830_g4482 [Neonectria ditissima]|uniref:Pyrroline-5-carboxylate reductase n=1 Tax=Neonectria ditissima TaxID=78410 RepID=A0A0P7B6E7_9HYPO|nr:hypothetical protein AK830_g4482 [Neonectria ditissima]